MKRKSQNSKAGCQNKFVTKQRAKLTDLHIWRTGPSTSHPAGRIQATEYAST